MVATSWHKESSEGLEMAKPLMYGARTGYLETVLIKRPVASLVPNPPQLVAELIDATNATWNEDLVRATFTQFDAAEILKIPLCTRRTDDFWAWHEESQGGFSVRSAYRMILRTKHNREAGENEHDG